MNSPHCRASTRLKEAEGWEEEEVAGGLAVAGLLALEDLDGLPAFMDGWRFEYAEDKG